MTDINDLPLGTEWTAGDWLDPESKGPLCQKCEKRDRRFEMVPDKAMGAIFDLICNNVGEQMGLEAFEVSLWACTECGHREGMYRTHG